MILTIWRHGEAGRAPTDRQRELTDRGFDDVGFGCRQFHAALSARGLGAPDTILYSPWVRTAETADVIAAAFNHARVREQEELRPGATAQGVAKLLQTMAGASVAPEHLILVSHQPLVSQLVDFFLDGGERVPALSPGGFATLQVEIPAGGCGTLCFWAMPPGYEVGV